MTIKGKRGENYKSGKRKRSRVPGSTDEKGEDKDFRDDEGGVHIRERGMKRGKKRAAKDRK